MDKNVGKDVSGWEKKRTKKKLVIWRWFWNNCLDTSFKIIFLWLQKRK